MLRHVTLGFAVLLAFAAAPAYGQEVKLQLKFKEGDKFWVEDVVTSKMNVSVSGVEVEKSQQKTTQVTSYLIKKVTADSVEMEMTVEDVDMKSEGLLGGQVGGVLTKTKGAVFTVTMTPSGKVKKFEGLDAVLKKFGNDPDAQMIKDALTEEMFVRGIEQAFGFVPDKAVKKGDTWTRETKYPLGPLGSLMSKNTYTYDGKGKDGEEIGVKSSMEYKAPKEAAFGGLFKVVKGDLKADNAKGTFVFDAEKGRMVSATASMRIGGTLTVETGGQQLPMQLIVDETATSKVHDKSPVK